MATPYQQWLNQKYGTPINEQSAPGYLGKGQSTVRGTAIQAIGSVVPVAGQVLGALDSLKSAQVQENYMKKMLAPGSSAHNIQSEYVKEDPGRKKERMAGAIDSPAAGAATGAGIGTMVNPGLGTVVGGVIGAAAGLFGGKRKDRYEEARRKEMLKARAHNDAVIANSNRDQAWQDQQRQDEENGGGNADIGQMSPEDLMAFLQQGNS